MATIENTPAEANPSRKVYLPDGVVDETALVPSSMLAEMISQTLALVGTVEKLSVGLVDINPSIVDCVRVPKGLMIQALTSRQFEVLSWMAQGFSNSAIAERLFVSRKTVENYINHIYHSLQLVHDDEVCSRVQAVLDYIDHTQVNRTNPNDVIPEHTDISSIRPRTSNNRLEPAA